MICASRASGELRRYRFLGGVISYGPHDHHGTTHLYMERVEAKGGQDMLVRMTSCKEGEIEPYALAQMAD
jgi:hypothetical protein